MSVPCPDYCNSEGKKPVFGVGKSNPDSKVHGANMGPIWGRQDPGGPHVGPVNLAIWEYMWH